MINEFICSIIGRDLQEYEEYSTYKNEYNEWCFRVTNMLTNEVVEQGAF